MRIALVGVETRPVEALLPQHGFRKVKKSPDVVISVGGDGTLLQAERLFPGIPKLPMKFSVTSRKIHDHKAEILLEKLAEGSLVAVEQIKLEAQGMGRILRGMNDIIFHNERVSSAVRYRVEINGKNQGGDIIGDGVTVATPFGSTAYYRSITHSIFQVGIGLAFNNSIEPIDHLVLSEDAIIQIYVSRGPALVAADNNPEFIHLIEGDSVTVTKAEESARILLMP